VGGILDFATFHDSYKAKVTELGLNPFALPNQKD
jgi:hypothetical protein